MSDILQQLSAALAGRYVLERELGRGGMATVFLAQDLRHDRPVALKVLHPELAQALGAERFLREIKRAARLQHPNILSVHDSGEAAGQFWFTMPYSRGEPAPAAQPRPAAPAGGRAPLAREAAKRSIAAPHGLPRDIKPGTSCSRRPALGLDFGISRLWVPPAGGAPHRNGIL